MLFSLRLIFYSAFIDTQYSNLYNAYFTTSRSNELLFQKPQPK
jgi:hypothetical protein